LNAAAWQEERCKTVEAALAKVARDLAEAHRRADPETKHVFWALDPEEREIWLVEVSGSVGDTGEILPYRFGPRPADGVPYASVVILLSPAEWEKVRSRELGLPAGGPSLDKFVAIEERQ
jgi:hypothetical protein